MTPILLFSLLLVLTFTALFLFLKPSSTEVAVERHLAEIKEQRPQAGVGPSILKVEALSTNPFIDDLLKQLPCSQSIARLIRQAGKEWSVSSILIISLVSALVSWWMGSFFIPADFLNI